jgi:hypothetical protein
MTFPPPGDEAHAAIDALFADLNRPPLPHEVHHRDGIPWHQAPLPRRWHRCRPQTSGWIRADRFERCACGAGRFDGAGPWLDRNSRRKEER